MDAVMNNWLVVAIVLPLVIGFFKTEIGNLIIAYNVYRLRAFDADGNPDTEEPVQILNGATGEWGDVVVERYRFWAHKKERGVYLRYPDGGREKVSFLAWAGWRKRVPPPRARC